MSKRSISLIRHGTVDGPAALYGHTDIALSSAGSAELLAAINRLHQQQPITRIVSSPLLRCAAPAREIARIYQLPLCIIDDLKEMHFGEWDGIPFDQFDEHRWQALNQFWETPASAHSPAGESLQQFAERIIACWKSVVGNTDAEHQLVICHGGVIRILIAHLLQLDWRNANLFRQLSIDYASCTRVEIANHPAALPIVKYIGATTF